MHMRRGQGILVANSFGPLAHRHPPFWPWSAQTFWMVSVGLKLDRDGSFQGSMLVCRGRSPLGTAKPVTGHSDCSQAIVQCEAQNPRRSPEQLEDIKRHCKVIWTPKFRNCCITAPSVPCTQCRGSHTPRPPHSKAKCKQCN